MFSRRIRLQLGRVLGEGDQGRVYEALRIDPATGLRQRVAVKVLHARTAIEAWRHEFSSLAGVRSPYCVRVLSFERVLGRPALVLEFVRGVSLAEWRRANLGDADDAREILAQVHQALLDLGRQGSYHGDLSPNNVLVDDQGVVRVLDFGLANGTGRCTPEFAAPERVRGGAPGYPSDLYSLGLLGAYLTPELDVSAALAGEPERRRPPVDEPPCPRRAARLAAKAAGRLANGAGVVRTEALAIEPTRDRASARLFAALAFVTLLNWPATPSLARTGFGALTLATREWHEFRLDGQTLGYGPVRLSVTSDVTHRLEWSSARGAGHLELRVRPGELRRLTDRDLPQRP